MPMEGLFIVLSPLNPDPMYKQITDQIKDAVATGQLAPETKLPSIREMARELDISAITIKRAYADLEKEGYILTRSGLGSYVADINREKLKREKLRQMRKELRALIKSAEKFGITEDDLLKLIKE
jgi:GntR family transcriptional regulator